MNEDVYSKRKGASDRKPFNLLGSVNNLERRCKNHKIIVQMVRVNLIAKNRTLLKSLNRVIYIMRVMMMII